MTPSLQACLDQRTRSGGGPSVAIDAAGNPQFPPVRLPRKTVSPLVLAIIAQLSEISK